MTKRNVHPASYVLAALSVASAALTFSETAPAELRMEYGADLRYRYERFDMEETSNASTLRLGLKARAHLGERWSGFAELEAVEQLFGNRYNVPTVPSQSRPGYPVIADPPGTEFNQAYLQYAAGEGRLQLRAGRQEVMLNNGRFISTAGLRQNHQSFDALRLSLAPAEGWTVDYGYITRVHRAVGRRASNGRADMASHFYNIGYRIAGAGELKTYGVLLDFDEEPGNSVNTYGVRFEGRAPRDGWHLLSTLEYAIQHDAGSNPNYVDSDYRVLELGVESAGIAYRVGYNQLSGRSATDKFITPLAHTFNSLTELFLTNPSLEDSHGLEVFSASVGGAVPRVQALAFMGTLYDYQSDTGSAHYGRGMDLMLEYRGLPKTIISWRYGKYWADELYTDAIRTSVYLAYSF